MLFPSCQTVKIKWLDELSFVLAFLNSINISKYGLVGEWASSPTSFQGWQLLFSFVVFTSLILHPRIRNEVKILNRTTLVSVLPVSLCHTFSVAVGIAGLSVLPIPIFIAWTNLSPAILFLIVRKSKTFKSCTVLSCLLICISVVTITVITFGNDNRFYYLCMLIYVAIDIIQSLYLKKVSLQIPDFTVLFYNNLVSLVALLPVSIYHATQTQPELRSFISCFFTGFFSLAVQLFAFRIKAKSPKFLTIQGVAQLFAILVALYMFEDDINSWVWCLIGINWFTTGFVLNLYDDDGSKNTQFILVVPNVTKNLYVEKYINYNDMA